MQPVGSGPRRGRRGEPQPHLPVVTRQQDPPGFRTTSRPRRLPQNAATTAHVIRVEGHRHESSGHPRTLAASVGPSVRHAMCRRAQAAASTRVGCQEVARLADPGVLKGSIMATYEPERHAEVLARVRAALGSSARRDLGSDGIGADLGRVCRAAVDALAMSGAAVTLKSADGSEAVVAAVDDDSRAIAELEFGLGEGPTRDAFQLGRPVLAPDLKDPGESRWVRFAPASVDTGACAIFAFPLAQGAARFGVLTMFKDTPWPLDGPTRAACLGLAEIATALLLDSADGHRDGGIDPGLSARLEFRTEIHQAQGMLMVALHTDLAEALARMRAHAFGSGRPLLAVAVDILEGRSSSRTGGPHLEASCDD